MGIESALAPINIPHKPAAGYETLKEYCTETVYPLSIDIKTDKIDKNHKIREIP